MNADTNGVSLSVTTPSNSIEDDQSRLLELPIELVARITSFVSTETIVTVRLTCKVLEAITFHRFATENFTNVYCWIGTGHDFKRLKDILHQSPRLSSKIRQVTLTTDPLAGQPQSNMNYVRPDYGTEYTALGCAMRCLDEPDALCCVEITSLLRMLQDLQHLNQDILITADLPTMAPSRQFAFLGFPPGCHLRYRQPQSILLALSLTRSRVHSLKVDRHTFHDSDDLQAFSRADLLASLTTLTTLEMSGEVNHGDQAMYVDILQGASRLQNLAFDTGELRAYPTVMISKKPLGPDLLLANPLSCLTSLRITRAVLDWKILIEVFARCQDTLTHMVLRHVTLSTNNDDLMPVHQAMLAMPRLAFLELQWQKVGPWAGYLFDVPHGGVCPESHMYKGVEPIKAWLRELLDNHLYLYHKKPDPEG